MSVKKRQRATTILASTYQKFWCGFNEKTSKDDVFCKEFRPEEKRIKSNAYQGPDYFSYQGKSLKKIRKERENQKG